MIDETLFFQLQSQNTSKIEVDILPRRYYPIAILTGLFFIAALTGYLTPDEQRQAPTRTLLNNKAGKVIFAHASHVELQNQECVTCHHTSTNEQRPLQCSRCHVKRFDAGFLANHPSEFDQTQCVHCHHRTATIENFSHDAHTEDYVPEDCQACHHDKSIEPEPQSCSNCHKENATEGMISLKEASHSRCADCHDDFFEAGPKGCKKCHARKTEGLTPAPQRCSSCHEESIDMLIPTTTNAYHAQCRGCHEHQSSGPYGDDSCYKCHMK